MTKKIPEQVLAGAKTLVSRDLTATQDTLLEQAEHDHSVEAAEFTEEIIGWLNGKWNEKEFTAEQRIFSIALATVNFRQHFPEERGGKAFFDDVAKRAWEYYASHKE